VDLLGFARILRRRWLLIVALTILGAGLGVASTAFHQKAKPTGAYYKSTDTLSTRHDSAGTSGYRSLNQVGLRVTSGNVPSLVSTKLGGNAKQLVQRITVTSNDALGTLQITAIARTAAEADRIAAAFGSELITALDAEGVQQYQDQTKDLLAKRELLAQREAELDAQIPTNPANVEDLRAERDATADELRLTLTQVAQHSFDSPDVSPVEEFDPPHAVPISKSEYDTLLQSGLNGDHLTQVDENGNITGGLTASSGPDLSNPKTRGVLGGLLGLLLGLAIAMLLDVVDRKVRTREELEGALGMPVLAEVPYVQETKDKSGVISVLSPYSRAAEAFRAVRSAVLFELVLAERDGDRVESTTGIVVMVVSGVAGEGKTTTTANLAAAFAEAGSSVLAINGDFRRPALHRLFGVRDVPGAILETGIPGVHIVTSVAVSPSATPAQVVDAQRRVVQATREHYDVILIDTTPLLSTNDAIDIAPVADLVVVVAQYGMTKTHHLRRTAELLARMRAPVVGAVLVAVPGHDAGYSYYYSSSPAPMAPAEAPEREASGSIALSPAGSPGVEPPPVVNGNGTGNGNGSHPPTTHPQSEGPTLSWRDPTGQPN
jgi:capsular exopolysaccharide synthesis family protein